MRFLAKSRKKYHRSIIKNHRSIIKDNTKHAKSQFERKRLRVYTIVDFSFIRTFAPSF